jgi:hypothetical protein
MGPVTSEILNIQHNHMKWFSIKESVIIKIINIC